MLCPLFSYCLSLPFCLLCSYCVKCCSFICSGLVIWSTHRLRSALCLSVHQFTGILWINTSPQQTAQLDLNDFFNNLVPWWQQTLYRDSFFQTSDMPVTWEANCRGKKRIPVTVVTPSNILSKFAVCFVEILFVVAWFQNWLLLGS